jgi:hypothetical protein
MDGLEFGEGGEVHSFGLLDLIKNISPSPLANETELKACVVGELRHIADKIEGAT